MYNVYNEQQLKEMKVDDLRKIVKEKGMPVGTKERRFNKKELIEKILSTNEAEKEETKEEPKEEKKPEKKPYFFANTFEEIVEKYSQRKQQKVYDNELVVGSFVVFVHSVVAKYNNETYKKLRTAKVVAVNRKSERVRVQTLLGTDLELSFDDLLYIKADRKDASYPEDINAFLKKRRTEKGQALINEKFKHS